MTPLLGTLIILIVLTMIASLQAVGVLLSLGLMVLPAATVYLLTDSYALLPWASGLLGIAGALVGLVISFQAKYHLLSFYRRQQALELGMTHHLPMILGQSDHLYNDQALQNPSS